MTENNDVKRITGRYFQEALKGRLQTEKKKLKLIISVIVLMFFTFFPLPIPQKIQWTLGISLFAALMWSFEVLPLPVTSLIVPVLLVAYGVFEEGATAAFASFAHPVIYILLSSIIIAEAIRKHGLDRRLSLMILSKIKGSIKGVLLALLFVTTFLSMWISNTAVLAGSSSLYGIPYKVRAVTANLYLFQIYVGALYPKSYLAK